MTLTELKKCPFCGGKATTLVYPYKNDLTRLIAQVECANGCIAKVSKECPYSPTFEDVISTLQTVCTLWNRREAG